MCDYGYSKKKGKDNFKPFYSQPEFTEKELKILSAIEQYYQIEDHSARETCEKFRIKHNNKIAKILASCFPKHKSNRIINR